METPVQCRRRKIGSRRFEVSIDVHLFSRSTEGTEREDLGVIRNLSMRGALIETHLSLTTGDQVTLDLTLPHQADLLTITQVLVRWIQGGQIGVEFLKVDTGTSRRLMLFLAGMHGAARVQCKPTDTTMLAISSGERAFAQP